MKYAIENQTEKFADFPVLETKRLVLREMVPADAEDLLVFTGDAYVQRYNAVPMTDVSQALDEIEQHKALYLRQDGVAWGITLKDEDRVIGRAGFHAWSLSNRAMLGYDLAREFWGRGLASEAIRAIIRFGYEEMKLNRIEAETIEDNHESRRMLERLGFTLEGIRREYSLEDDGEYHGSAMYGLLYSEYRLMN
jgi:ribosomal-protein-alanine N-acetyltransferase